MLLKSYTQYASKFGKLSSGHRTGKDQFYFQFQRRAIPKECPSYCTIALILHGSKVMLKILQDRLPQYMNHELPDVQGGYRKGRGIRDQIVYICWTTKKQENIRKTSIFALLTTPNTLTAWITTDCGKFLKRWQYQTT